jgi:hypothetical protein
MRRRNDPRLPACRRTHRSNTLACFWTLFTVSAGIGLHPLPIAAQTDFGRLSVNPFLSLAPAQAVIRWAQSEDGESSGVLKGALIGAAIGGVLALVAFEVGENIVDLCDPADNSPTQHCDLHSGRPFAVLLGAVAGAAIGAFIGSRRSSRAWTPLPQPFVSSDGGLWVVPVHPNR